MPCGNKAESAKAYSSCPRLMCRSFGNGSGNGEYAGEGSCVGDCGGKSPLLIRSYTCYRWKVVAPPRFAARRIVPQRSATFRNATNLFTERDKKLFLKPPAIHYVASHDLPYLIQ